MALHEERRKVLDMLAAGQISAEQASELLGALDEERGQAEPSAPIVRRKGTAKALRISIDDPGDPDKAKSKPTRVRINVPLGLAKLAARFIPRDAKAEIEGHGIDVQELLSTISADPPEGPLVDIDVDEAGPGGRHVKILIEVV